MSYIISVLFWCDFFIIFGFCLIQNISFKAYNSWVRSDGSVVKILHCSCSGPGFSSHNAHGGSQRPVTPVPEDLLCSSDTHGF